MTAQTKGPLDIQQDKNPIRVKDSSSPPSADVPHDRRMSKEWDAAKVPPSRFQKKEGSIYGTPSTRDGHVKGSERDKSFHDKLKEKGWLK